MDPDQVDVPTDPATLYAVCGALSRRVDLTTMDALVRYAERLPAEFSTLLISDCERVKPDVVATRAYARWAARHNELLN